jgi:phosphoribosylanthranilate isomerase
MTFVKICGITNLEDALAAVDAGADALGFNFYRKSSRYIEPLAARRIIEQLPKKILTVGVFVNEETPDDVRAISTAAGVRALQLHGDESASYCSTLKDSYVIKAFGVNKEFDVGATLNYTVDAIMLDAGNKVLRGGTGEVFDWTVARRVKELGVTMYLAGGLSPENVREAIETVGPYAVDACSSLEQLPGKKDHRRLQEFLKAVHS